MAGLPVNKIGWVGLNRWEATAQWSTDESVWGLVTNGELGGACTKHQYLDGPGLRS